MDDSRIVELYLSRDETAVAHTAEKFGSRLRALSYGIVRDHQTAEECENDTYLKHGIRFLPMNRELSLLVSAPDHPSFIPELLPEPQPA